MLGKGVDSGLTARLIATLAAEPSRDELVGLSKKADVLEVRGDLVGDLDPGQLRTDFDGELLYTLRSEEQGGGPKNGERRDRIERAVSQYDLVDLEKADVDSAVLQAVPQEKRLLSWHGSAADVAAARQRFETLAETPARLYKIVPRAERPKDALVPLGLLAALGRDDVVAFSSGVAGFWSRLLAPYLGASVVYGSAGAVAGAEGQMPVADLRRDYGLPRLPKLERLYGLVGRPAHHSLSPRLHNTSYRALGLDFLYLPFEPSSFGDFWLDVVERGSLEVMGFRLAGLSVTAPFKEIALAVAGAVSPVAERVGAANTLVRRGQVWEAETTDITGVAAALAAHARSLAGRRAAVLGSGGAGRAAAFALEPHVGSMTMVNRGAERGRRVALELGVNFCPLDEFDPSSCDLLVNATPLGRHAEGPFPAAPERLASNTLVVDLAYDRAGPTPWVEALRRRGIETIDGREVLLHQAVPQFRLMTGVDLPLAEARRALDLDGGDGPSEDPDTA